LLPQVSPDHWEELVALADQQQVAPLLYQRLQMHGIASLLPAETLRRLQKSQRSNAMRNLRLYHELAELLKALQSQKIPVIVLKGAYLAQDVYQTPALRFMVDYDLMIPEADLPSAVEILTALGYRPLQPIPLATSKAVGHHLPRFLRENDAASVEIHWTITRPDKTYTIAMASLWARAQPFTVAGLDALALCREDMLLHLCLHATYQHFFLQGVRPLCDITEVVTRYGTTLDWDQFCQRCVEWGWEKGVYLALYVAHTLMGAAIPSQVLMTLRPAAISSQLVEAARSQLFAAHTKLGSDASTYLMQIATDERPMIDKAKLVAKRSILSRRQMAYKYAVPLDSPRLYLYYLARFWYLLMRYRQKAWRTLWKDPEIKAAARHRNRILEWLEQAHST
jgi:hypothetical protein